MERNEDMEANAWVDARLASLQASDNWEPDVERAWNRITARPVKQHPNVRWAIAAAVACAALMAFPQPRAITQRICTACLAAAQSLASPEPSRKAAPDFSLDDALGQRVSLSSLRGKVVVLNFWATWCPPCKMEIPWLVEFQQTYRDRDLVIVGVSMDEDGWEAVKPFMERMKINYPMVIGNDEVAARFGGVESLPTTLLIDRSGRIAATHTGLVSKSEYRRGIEKLLR
jgi:cytochrome c biogenesis protein CcmG/thiol:disulfide interchange protein DsbE